VPGWTARVCRRVCGLSELWVFKVLARKERGSENQVSSQSGGNRDDQEARIEPERP